jgi:phosphoribosyl-AMP cyclohydrolase
MSELNFNDNGLIPAIIQDIDTGEVLMLGYMNEESLRRTLTHGEVWFYSRSRQELWHKGETSGNIIKVVEIRKDCENNSLLVKARPTGPVCHTGNRNCFFRMLEDTD